MDRLRGKYRYYSWGDSIQTADYKKLYDNLVIRDGNPGLD